LWSISARVVHPVVRYHDGHQIRVVFLMGILCRFLLVCVFALLGMRGANACEHMPHDAVSVSHVTHAQAMQRAHCSGVDRTGCTHHAGCCSVGCGLHCWAPTLESRIDTHTSAHDAPSVRVAALRAGITHAPPLPPPIV
jgi:hypothetical protein